MEFLNSKKGIEKGQGSNSLKFECCLRRYCLFSEGYKVALLLYPHHWETHSEGNRAGPIWIQVWHCSSLLTSAFLTNENYDSDVRDDTETFLNRIVPEVLVRNVPPDPDESVSELVEHFFSYPSNGVLPQSPMHTKSLAVLKKQLIRRKMGVVMVDPPV
ncbi:hypothetical protein HN51_047570 [Arachis hypogaea]